MTELRLRGHWVTVPDREAQGVIIGVYKFQVEAWVELLFPSLGGITSVYKFDEVELDLSKERSWDSAGNPLTKTQQGS